MKMQLSDFSLPLTKLSREAGRLIMDVYRSNSLNTSHKCDGSPVTRADKIAENCILSTLEKIAPGITIISEENIESHKLKAPELYFLVDPLDGTKEFLSPDGMGAFTVNIALIQNREPVLGVVYAPALDELYVGSKNGPTYKEEGGIRTPLKVRKIPTSGACAVASKSHFDKDTNNWLNKQGIKNSKFIGSSLKFCLIAAGEADIYPRFSPTMEWDTAAGDAILRAAGGEVVSIDEKALEYGKPEFRNNEFIARSKH